MLGVISGVFGLIEEQLLAETRLGLFGKQFAVLV
jgi:hypothetical protein